MKTKEFFEKCLQAPLKNQGWSWGSLNEANRRIFLRVHRDLVQPNPKSPKQVLLHGSSWSKPRSADGRRSGGDRERLEHIELLQHGYRGFAVVYWNAPSGDRWKTTGFDHRFLLRLGKLRIKNGEVYAEVLERLPVDAVVGNSWNKAEEDEIDSLLTLKIPETDRRALVKARVGQGVFRDQVLMLWDYKCAVTGCAVKEALRASHIKPWSESSNHERLDPNNGLPLLATIDSLFDKHLISFNSQGKMLISSELDKVDRQLLLPKKCRLLRKPSSKTAKLLEAHSKLLR